MKYYVEGYDFRKKRKLYMMLFNITQGSIAYQDSKNDVLQYKRMGQFVNSLAVARQYIKKQLATVCNIGNFKIKKWN